MAEPRAWTLSKGQKVVAEYLCSTRDSVTLKDAMGIIATLQKKDLSKEDRAFIKTLPRDADTKDTTIFEKELSKNLVYLNNKQLESFDDKKLQGIRYYGIYFSANWCPPCHRFTPDLVAAYKKIKKKSPNFELIFVSSDKNEDEMLSYMKDYEMAWPAVKFSKRRSLEFLKKYQARGIPNLVFVDAGGNVLLQSYVNGQYVGPSAVLDAMTNQLTK